MDNNLKTRRWQALRASLIHDDTPCAHCGATPGARGLDLDHITPRALGGDIYDPANLRALCQHCNRSAGQRLGQFLRATRRPRLQSHFLVSTGSMRVGPGSE